MLLFFSLGLAVGSFINAVVWRIHERQTSNVKRPTSGRATNDDQRATSIWRGRSMCPDCRHQLAAIDLVPVLSWLWLKGRCRYCHKPISIQYPLVELVTAVLFGLYSIQYPVSSIAGWVHLGFWLYLLTVLIILAIYDWRWMLLPDQVLLPAIVVALLQLVLNFFLGYPLPSTLYPLLAGLAAGGFFYALVAVSRGKWMGGGDIKLAFFMGLILGWSKLAVAMLVGFNSAAIIGVILIGLKLKGRRDFIAFGPFLVFGTIVAQLFGTPLIDWYLRWSIG